MNGEVMSLSLSWGLLGRERRGSSKFWRIRLRGFALGVLQLFCGAVAPNSDEFGYGASRLGICDSFAAW